MANKVKKLLNKSRDKLLGNLVKPIQDIDERSKTLEHNQAVLLGKQIELMIESRDNRSSTLLKISDDEVIAKIFSGIKMSLWLKDISVTPHLALDGIWERHITYAWLRALGDKDVVIDIGANFGYFGLLAAQKTHQSRAAKTIFFEANPELIPYINKSLSLNNFYEFSVVENLAVSNTKDTLELTVLKDYIGSSSVHSLDHLDQYVGKKIPLKAESVIKVNAVTIDDYCVSNKIKTVDLIKMDIEGYEDIAYEGMQKTVQSSPNLTLFIEFTKFSYKDPEGFYDKMLNDFKRVYTIDNDGNLLTPKDPSYDNVLGSVDDWVMLVFSKKILAEG